MSACQIERRLHFRVALSGVTARIALKASGGRRRRVALVDLSLDGLCWRDSEPADHGTPVTISFRTHRLFGRSLRLDAIIVRHDAVVTAAQFMPVQDRSRLQQYLRGWSPDADPSPDVTGPGERTVPLDTVAAFRLLGVSLDQSATDASRLIVVASARPADGKSFVAAGLASSLAAMGRQVLVVDADLHAPTQHLQFVAKGSPGLAQILAEPTLARVRAAIQLTDSGVALLAAGAAGIAPSQLMSRDMATELSSVLRGLGYQVVVIDCPPILTSAETLLFSRIADETVLTVRSGATRERDVKQALDVLQRNGTPAAGVILNDYKDAIGVGRHSTAIGSTTDRADQPSVVRDTIPIAEPPASPLPAGRVIV